MHQGARSARTLLLAVLVGTAACSSALGPVPLTVGEVALAPAASADTAGEIRLQYLGIGGWRIETPGSLLLTGPLLSRPPMLEVGFGAVMAPDTLAILEALEAWDVGPLDETDAILIGHGHYDHLLDTPWMAARLAPRARVLGNRTTRFQTMAFAESLGFDTLRIEDVTPLAASPSGPGEWIRVGDDVRVLPVLGDHAPHFAGHTLYEGERTRPLSEPPGPATDWLAGRSLAFLIDVLSADGEVVARIYYHDAIPREPGGIVPAEVLADGIPVDVAILVPASFSEVEWHPESLVQNLEPRVVLVQHWESFFHSAGESAKPVMFTILPDFMKRLVRVMECESCVYLPEPGARFRLPLRAPGLP